MIRLESESEMVFSNQFIAVITCQGKILRELYYNQESKIRIPFGEEYDIRLKNLSSLRAVVDVSVDGVDALNGSRLVLAAGETHDLEGFMNGNVVRNRFKFIKKTEQIADYRGDRIDDGIVQVKYQFEKEPTYFEPVKVIHHWPKYPEPWYPYRNPCWPSHGNEITYGTKCNTRLQEETKTGYGSLLRSGPGGSSCASQSISNDADFCTEQNLVSRDLDSPVSDEGITVKGSQTNINYSMTYLGELYPDVNTIIFKLVGETITGHKVVRTPVTVRTHLTCPTCGTRNTSRNRYCSNCGTCLE